jgi:hypothetical protein
MIIGDALSSKSGHFLRIQEDTLNNDTERTDRNQICPQTVASVISCISDMIKSKEAMCFHADYSSDNLAPL